MKTHVAILSCLFLASALAGEKPKAPGLPEERGNSARVEVMEQGDKVVYTAALVQIERFGQYAWIKKKLDSPRPICQFRTTRQRGDGEVEQVGPRFNTESGLSSLIGSPKYKGVPWTPSILVNDGVVWVLFTTCGPEFPGFDLYSFRANEPGRKPVTKDVIAADQPAKAPDSSVPCMPYLEVKLSKGWQDDVFSHFKGGFAIRGFENGELVMAAPALLPLSPALERERDSICDIEFKVAQSNHESNPAENPEPPVHYKELMKDQKIVLRYHVAKKVWSLEIPKGLKSPSLMPIPDEAFHGRESDAR